MATRIDLSQDIKINNPFKQEAKPNSDIFTKVGQKGSGLVPPPGVLTEEAEGKGKGPGEGPGKAPRKQHPDFFKEGGEGLKSPFEHFSD